MMKTNTTGFLALLLLLTAFSCRAVYEKVPGFDKKSVAPDKAAYHAVLHRNYELDTNTVLFLKEDRVSFIDELVQRRISYYLGTFLNDSTELCRPQSLRDHQSCWGLILHSLDSSTGSCPSTTSLFREYRLYRMGGEGEYRLEDNGKMKMVLLYALAMGASRRPDFRRISRYIREHSARFELLVIALDEYGTLAP